MNLLNLATSYLDKFESARLPHDPGFWKGLWSEVSRAASHGAKLAVIRRLCESRLDKHRQTLN